MIHSEKQRSPRVRKNYACEVVTACFIYFLPKFPMCFLMLCFALLPPPCFPVLSSLSTHHWHNQFSSLCSPDLCRQSSPIPVPVRACSSSAASSVLEFARWSKDCALTPARRFEAGGSTWHHLLLQCRPTLGPLQLQKRMSLTASSFA